MFTIDCPPLEALEIEQPALCHELETAGYSPAAEDTLGRCQKDCTLYLSFDEGLATTRAWIFDVSKNKFVGTTFVVMGSAPEAIRKARQLVEDAYAQEFLSGGLEYRDTEVEQVILV
ncbi:hypothetical protein LC612_33070 [Nostoc sp. CHAB 5834]|nr:hypothetical protein [Nostoc sp. CHAB 5834]